MKEAILAGVMIVVALLVAFTQPARAANDADGVVLFDDENGNFGWTWTASTGTTIGLVEIRRFQDLNNDGDFSDANENILVGSATSCPAINGGETLSCQLATANAGRSIVIFKNQSVEHVPGNYSMKIELHNGVGAVVDSVGYSVFIRPGTSATEGRQVAEHQGSRALVNQSYANLTTFGVPCSFNCTGAGNASINVSLFTTQCHGTPENLCVNGHSENFLNNELLRFLGVTAGFIMMAWFAVSPGLLRPVLSFFLSVAFIFFMVSHQDFFQSSLVTHLFTGATIFPMVIGGFRMFTSSQDRFTRKADS